MISIHPLFGLSICFLNITKVNISMNICYLVVTPLLFTFVMVSHVQKGTAHIRIKSFLSDSKKTNPSEKEADVHSDLRE